MTSPDRYADLHVHSTASDGTLSPTELVVLAKERDVGILSITDHDTVDGIPEGMYKAREQGVRFIPGVELSVDLEQDDLSAHLLGYFPGLSTERLTDPESDLGKAISFVQSGRSARNPRILEKLRGLGMEIDPADVERIAGGDVIGRPHIAEAMVASGFVGDTREAFSLYLAKGRPAYSDRDRLSISTALKVIVDAGGLPILAHPGYIGLDPAGLDRLTGRLVSMGLAGLEVFYPGHDPKMVETLRSITERMALLATGGTDFHGWRPDSMGLGGSPGNFTVTPDMIAGFLERCDEIRETEVI